MTRTQKYFFYDNRRKSLHVEEIGRLSARAEPVGNWVLSRCRIEHAYGRTKKEQDVRYVYKGSKRSFAEGFARRHHDMKTNTPVFNSSGTAGSSTPSETTFKKHWPKEIEMIKWWECVCLECGL